MEYSKKDKFDNQEFHCNLSKEQPTEGVLMNKDLHIKLIHPECPDGYVFIGNMPRSAFRRLDWNMKYEGQICYDQGGEQIPQGGTIPEQRLVPVFVSREEFEDRQGKGLLVPLVPSD
jgi:hypothetical protein